MMARSPESVAQLEVPARLHFRDEEVFAEISGRALGGLLLFERLELSYPRLSFPLKIERGMDDFRRRTSLLKHLRLKVALRPLVERLKECLSGGLFQCLSFELRPPWHASVRGLWTNGPYPSYFVLDISLHASGGKILILPDDIRVYSLGGPPPVMLVGQLCRSLPGEWLSMAPQGAILLEPLGWLCARIAEACGWLRHPEASDTVISEIKVLGEEILIEAGLPLEFGNQEKVSRMGERNWLEDRPEALMAEGDMQLLLGEPQAAENLYAASVQSRPEVLQASMRLAQLLASIPGRMEECESLCRKGLNGKRDFWPLELILALTEELRGDLQSSLSRYRVFLHRYGENSKEYPLDLLPVHFKAGQLCQSLGLTREANEHFHKVLDLDHKAYPAMEFLSSMDSGEKRWHEAYAWLQRAIEEAERYDDHDRVASMLQSVAGIQTEGYGNREEAMSTLRRAVRMHVHCFGAWERLACLEEETGEVERAEKTLRKAWDLSKENEDREAQANLSMRLGGLLFERLSKEEEGFALVLDAARIMGQNEDAWNRVVYLGESRKAWDAVAEGYSSLGRIRAEKGQRALSTQSYLAAAHLYQDRLHRRQEAVDAFRSVVEQDREVLDAWTSLVSLYTLRNEWENAALAHEQVARINFKSLHAEEAGRSMFMAGEILRVECSDATRAQSCYNRALEMAPDQVDARKALGMLLYRSKRNPGAALSQLSWAARINPMDPEVIDTLACVYRELSKVVESRLLFALLSVLEGKKREEADRVCGEAGGGAVPRKSFMPRSLCGDQLLRGPLAELVFLGLDVLQEPLRWYSLPPCDLDSLNPLPADEADVFQGICKTYVGAKEDCRVEGWIGAGKGKGWYVRTDNGIGVVLPQRTFVELPDPCRRFMWGKLLWNIGSGIFGLFSASAEDWGLFLKCIRTSLGFSEPFHGSSPWAELALQLKRRMKRKTRKHCIRLLGQIPAQPDLGRWVVDLTRCGDRAGLLVCKDSRWALQMLLWSRGLPWPLSSSRMTLSQSLRKKKDPEFHQRILDLCRYATTQEYFDTWRLVYPLALDGKTGSEWNP